MKRICIQARRDGFRRAGLSHPAETVEHAYDRFTPAQVEQLLAEPMLMVTVVDRAEVEVVAEGEAERSKGGRGR